MQSSPFLHWIATLTAHIPNKGEQLVRYYGYYSNVARGKKKKEEPIAESQVSWKPEFVGVPPLPISKELKKRWSHFIQKVYGTGPLVIPSEHWLCPLGRSTTATAFLSKELLSAQDAIN